MELGRRAAVEPVADPAGGSIRRRRSGASPRSLGWWRTRCGSAARG